MRSARSRGRGQKRRLNYVPDANVGRIVRCRRRAPSIFQLPWKFRSWETRFASVHTLNNVAVQSATAPSLLSFLSLPKKRVGGEGKERKERNKNKKMVSVIVARDSIPVDFFRSFYRTLVTASSSKSFLFRSKRETGSLSSRRTVSLEYPAYRILESGIRVSSEIARCFPPFAILMKRASMKLYIKKEEGVYIVYRSREEVRFDSSDSPIIRTESCLDDDKRQTIYFANLCPARIACARQSEAIYKLIG